MFSKGESICNAFKGAKASVACSPEYKIYNDQNIFKIIVQKNHKKCEPLGSFVPGVMEVNEASPIFTLNNICRVEHYKIKNQTKIY